MKKILLLALLFTLSTSAFLFAEDKKETIKIDRFLVAGPVSVNTPVTLDGTDYDMDKFLDVKHINQNEFWPVENEKLHWASEKEIKWKTFESGADFSFSSDLSLIYFAAYVEVERFTKVGFKFKSHSPLKLFVNGKEVAKKKKQNKQEKKPGKLSKKIELETGKHLVLIKAIVNKNKIDDFEFSGKIEVDKKFADYVKVSTNHIKQTDISNLLNDPKVKAVSISADGKTAAVVVSRRTVSGKAQSSWISFYDVKTKTLIKSNQGFSNVTGISWAPAGSKYAFTTRGKKSTNLFVSDFKSGETNLLLEEHKDFGSYKWAPDGTYLIFSQRKKIKEFSPDLKKFDSLDDRYPWGIYRSNLYKINFPEGTVEQITFGDVTTSLNSISPDSKSILFTQNKRDMSERPFSKNTLYKMNLETYKVEKIHTSRFGLSASWSPDGKQLLIFGSPTTFGSEGLDLPENVIPNDYDAQAYIYNLDDKSVKAITKSFNPSISSADWMNNNYIYFRTVDKTYSSLYKYDVKNDEYNKIDLGVESVQSIDFDKQGSYAVYRGASSNVYAKAYIFNVKSNKYELLLDANKKNYSNIKLGDVKDFNFKNREGLDIKGRVYYPPNFDKTKKYPAIINYYAGTSPMTRGFEGRYPANIWAANGYIVYILTPQGAYGFGQKFSAKHVNDWGEITAREIIKGAEEFIKAHSFVDKDKIGIIGASYGGFETMNLITKTDMFAAAISHAGISALSSYWGEGYWGFSYSAVASANSYPWNNRKLYVDQSPLFNADKINTPLLLLHGDSDTNVPVGESYQMYVALKILNKPVEMVTVKGLDHHIMEYNKRKKWTKTIIAYFDKILKDQPEWWNKLYKKAN